MPVTTGSSKVPSGRLAKWEPAATSTRCETSSAVHQVVHQQAGDAEPPGDDAGDVDGVVADPLDGADDLEHGRHRLRLPGVADGHDAEGPHPVHQIADLLLQLVDLVGHVGVVEEQRGVGQVDHQLARVLGVGQHVPQRSLFHALRPVSPHRELARGRVSRCSVRRSCHAPQDERSDQRGGPDHVEAGADTSGTPWLSGSSPKRTATNVP